MRKVIAKIPNDCKQLIDRITSTKSDSELLSELLKFGTQTWTVAKCELYHWVDVLDRFDEVLARAVSRVAPPKMDGGFKQPAPVVPESCKIENLPGNQNSSNDMDTSDKNISVPNFSIALEHNPLLKNLAIEVIQFTRLLVEYSCSRHIYNSIESVLDLLLATDFNVILPVLNLLYIFAKRSNY